jgi:hypothetical protein
MGLFDRSTARHYALCRKIAQGLLRWERSLATPEQFAQPRISGLVTLDENNQLDNRTSRQFQNQIKIIWHRLYVRDADAFFAAKQREDELTRWPGTSSDMPLVYVPPIIS